MPYHVNPKTSRANLCEATIRSCKYAENGVIPPHFDTKDEAKEWYLAKLAKENSAFSSLSKPKNTTARKENQKSTESSIKESNTSPQNPIQNHTYEPNEAMKKLLKRRLRGELHAKEYRETIIDGQTEFEGSLGSSGYRFSLYVEGAQNRQAFLFGKCAYLADEIHQITGKPLVIFTDVDKSEKLGSWQGHAAVKVGEDAYLDLEGILTADEVKARYRIKNISVEEVSHHDFKHRVGKGDEPLYHETEALEKALVEKIARDLVFEEWPMDAWEK